MIITNVHFVNIRMSSEMGVDLGVTLTDRANHIFSLLSKASTAQDFLEFDEMMYTMDEHDKQCLLDYCQQRIILLHEYQIWRYAGMILGEHRSYVENLHAIRRIKCAYQYYSRIKQLTAAAAAVQSLLHLMHGASMREDFDQETWAKEIAELHVPALHNMLEDIIEWRKGDLDADPMHEELHPNW